MAREGRSRIPTWLLFRIAARDQWQCHICDKGYRPDDPWEIDHDIALARSRGGAYNVSNLKLSHRGCNREKAAA